MTVIYRIENAETPYKVNETTAKALAHALDLFVGELFDDSEVSHLGRPAHTGKAIGKFQVLGEHEMLCPGCHLVVPRAVGCFDCAS